MIRLFLIYLLLLISTIDIIICDYNPKYEEANINTTFTCEDLKKWLGTEKHYSHPEKKKYFFSQITSDSECKQQSVLLLKNMNYGYINKKQRKYFAATEINLQTMKDKIDKKLESCTLHDDKAVVVLSNFSIKHNFSHFLHSILRLFCALIDAKYLSYDTQNRKFIKNYNFTLWFDDQLPLTDMTLQWYRALSMGSQQRVLKKIPKGQCVSANSLIYGNGCVQLLAPEKWYGYPGCRAHKILPAFGEFMRERFKAPSANDLRVTDYGTKDESDLGLRVAFAVRDVGHLTGQRRVSNLLVVQNLLNKSKRMKASYENITFEHLDGPSTVRFMAGVHVFISVHGAGMTNLFFMNHGAAVIEVMPFPLCHCKSPDYFYGIGGYYHGASKAVGVNHYTYCVPKEDTKFHKEVRVSSHPEYGWDVKCSWKHLHSVESIRLDPTHFVSFMRAVERDLIINGVVTLKKPAINMNPHANG